MDRAVKVGKLPNGITYYIRRNAKPEKRAELRLVVNAGSILEDEDQLGLAHYVEHMAFNGTTSFAKNDIVKYLESIGVRFGADLNAFTGFDETVYILPVPTDSPGILERSFRFLGDVASGIRFDSLEVVNERGVVLSEWRNGLGAGERLRDKQFPVLLRGSRYAERLPIGKPAILENANPAPLKRFWRDWYRPDLMAVIAVGDVEPAVLEQHIRRTFSGIPARPRARARTQAAVPGHDSTLVSIATDKELTTSSVEVLWKRPPRSTRTVGDLRSDLLERLYNTMLSQRFNELALKPDAPFTSAGASSGGFVRGSEYNALGAGAKEGKLIETLQAVLVEAERVQRHGFLASELDRARTNLLRAYERAYEERDKSESAEFVEEYIQHYLQGDGTPGIAFEYAAVQKLMPAITLADVNGLANARGGAANRVVMVTLPEKEGLAVPTEAEIRRVFGTVVASTIAPWTETVAEGALVAKVPTPGKVVRERTIAPHGITEWTLSNGITVLIKPTDFNADQILMSAWSPGGASLVSDTDVFKTSMTPLVIAAGGVGEFSAVDLRKKLTGKAASAQPGIADLSETIVGGASPRDLETLMQLTWLRFTSPRADTTVFQANMQAFESQLRNKDANPASVFSDTVQMTLANGHPRVRPLNTEMLKELQLDDMLKIYKDRFGDAGDFTFVFVGNVDAAVLKPLAEQWLASLPAAGRRETPRDVGPKQFTGQIDKVVRKGIAPQSQTALLIAGVAPWSREDAYLLSSVGDLLEQRLLDRLREALGATYSVSVSTGFSRRPRQEWQVVVSYGSAPDKADSLFAAVRSELDSLRRVPPSQAEVDRVREKQRRALEVQRKQNNYWTGAIRSRVENGDPLEGLAKEEELYASLSIEKLAAAAKKFFDETNRARFVLLPEK
ncbi:MAG: insulinase family protein [Gemmatimonadaceae bacterium]|nr:insulinase family protein [Gemmatimonadaceae bacterium]